MGKTVRIAGQERRRRRSASEWRGEVAAWRKSGLKAAEYAASRGLRPSTLLWWSSVGRREGGDGKPARVEKRQETALSFVPVQVRPAGRTDQGRSAIQVEVVLSGGRRVRLVGELGLEQFARLVEVLEGGTRC
jgi:hypothetical protein